MPGACAHEDDSAAIPAQPGGRREPQCPVTIIIAHLLTFCRSTEIRSLLALLSRCNVFLLSLLYRYRSLHKAIDNWLFSCELYAASAASTGLPCRILGMRA